MPLCYLREDSITSEVATASDLSNVKSASSVQTDSVATASDATASRKAPSSIHTESGAAGGLSPRSKADSITEDLASEQGRAYSPFLCFFIFFYIFL